MSHSTTFPNDDALWVRHGGRETVTGITGTASHRIGGKWATIPGGLQGVWGMGYGLMAQKCMGKGLSFRCGSDRRKPEGGTATTK